MDSTNQEQLNADAQMFNQELKFNQPKYDPNVDYYREFYKLNLQNENILGDIENTGKEKNQIEKQIFRILDFYNTTLIPLMESCPEKFLKRMEK